MNNLTEKKVRDALDRLYTSCGYTQYKMSKFEEYELYAENKSFLPSKSIITFTDTDGRLMALKPDVTLSIVKNSDDKKENKLYYNESVYRADRYSNTFAEIAQTGLEYIGKIDAARIFEVLMLAEQSLRLISDDYVLDVSHSGIVSAVLDRLGVNEKTRAALLSCVEGKNLHEAKALCGSASVTAENTALLETVMTLDPEPDAALSVLASLPVCAEETAELAAVISSLDKAHVRIDLSVLNDTGYYNGVIFRGYIKGVPSAVLSGGRYDTLLKRMGKTSGAVGFAVYLDRLSDLYGDGGVKRYDRVILYDGNSDISRVTELIGDSMAKGLSYTALHEPDGCEYGEIYDLRCGNGE